MKGRRSSHHALSPAGSPPSDSEGSSVSKEQDRFLPIANVSRIMKKSLPTNAKISKEAKETVQECVSEFISFITGEASDKCQREKRKTINGDDLLWAMTTLGFENYVSPLKVYLNKYRDIEGEKNSMARQGDQSPPHEPSIGLNNTSSSATSGTGMASNTSLSGFNTGFYSTAPSVAAQGFAGGGGRMMAYEEKSKSSGSFSMGRVNGGGEANGARALPSHLHGVHW